MTDEKWTEVDRYFEGQLSAADPALDEALADSDAAGLPSISVSPAQGKLLFILAKAMGARRILELGTLGGYSGIWLARALPADGRLVTVEVDPAHARVARANFARAGVMSRIDLRLGAAEEVLRALRDEASAPFDMVFIDADKVRLAEYLDGAIRLCRPGSLIIADNVVRQGAVADPASEDDRVRGTRRFIAALGADRRVAAAAIQTVGAKGYDGFAAMVVLES